VEAEYASIRKAVALMDAPHRSVVVLTGKDRLAFLNNVVTNDTKKLTPNQGVTRTSLAPRAASRWT